MTPGNEATVRLVSFLLVFGAVFAAERIAPRRDAPIKDRWLTNLGLTIIDAAMIRAVPAITAYSAALWTCNNDIGLFNWLNVSPFKNMIFSVLFLDVAIYFQHRLFHSVPGLWRLHKVHHADTAIDATTGLRFHPAEIVLSMLIKTVVVFVTGASPAAVVLFEAILNGCSVFNHGNFRWPAWLEPKVRSVLVTPDMHRIHHSKVPIEMNSNFGFSVPWWDRAFRTYREEPEKGQTGMDIGLSSHPVPLSLIHALELPFRPVSHDENRAK